MKKQKRVAAIHDISGFGRCSLTVALPIISSVGIETAVIPTAVLSTHTGGLTGFTYRDLTADLTPFAEHWQSLNLKFDALYSGFLGSFEQIEIVKQIFKMFKTQENIIVVDPAMADHGKMYSVFDMSFAKEMKKLCKEADIIIPNITEAAFMLDEEYKEGPYEEEYIERLLKGLIDMGAKNAVLTGIYFNEGSFGAACIDGKTGEINYAFSERIKGQYHGTGDVYASAFLASYLNGILIKDSIQIAVDFTCESIKRTSRAGTDVRFGVNFEYGLLDFAKEVRGRANE